MPDVRARLEGGASVADIGCGRGRALVKLAQTFPPRSSATTSSAPRSIAPPRMHRPRASPTACALRIATGHRGSPSSTTSSQPSTSSTTRSTPSAWRDDPPGSPAGRRLSVPRHQLLRQVGGQPGTARRDVPRHQRPVPHDHLARSRRCGARDAGPPHPSFESSVRRRVLAGPAGAAGESVQQFVRSGRNSRDWTSNTACSRRRPAACAPRRCCAPGLPE